MNLGEILKQEGVKVLKAGEHHHARTGWLQLDCPFCGRNSGRYHMGLSERGWYFSCYRCGKLNTADTVAELLQVPVPKALEILRQADRPQGMYSPAFLPVKKRELVLPRHLEPLGRKHRAYLEKRRFDPDEIIETWKVQGIGMLPMRLCWRIFIPIFLGSEMVSWTTRSILKSANLRYISASEEEEAINHKTILYGEQYCNRSICIVEGPISGWAIGRGACATCGLGFTQPQLLRMAKYTTRVICFDAEPSAQRRARRLCNSLAPFEGETINVVLSAKDPAEALKTTKGRKELKRIREIIQ